MAAVAIQNPHAPVESKSARKKKAKALVERTESPAPTTAATAAPAENAPSVSAADGSDDGIDNVYIRELQKQIRNVTKKVNNASKTEAVVAERKDDKTLDQLVELKVINADQKLQLQKKPELEKQLKQLEEQLEQHKKVEQEHRVRLAAQEKALTENFEKEKAELVAELKEKSEADTAKTLSDSLLILSQFLRLAAARRAEDVDATADENLALEGVLLLVYSGDENAVATMLKLVNGADEQTRSISNELLQTTFAQVKEAATASPTPLFPVEASAEPEGVAEPATESAVESKQAPDGDSTIANASLTEIEEGSTIPLTNGDVEEPTTNGNLPANMLVEDSAANAVGETQWDTGNEMTMSQEWVDVKVPRDPAETETGLSATPAAPTNTQSWADDQPEAHMETPAAPARESNDGFLQVQRNRGNREGGWRGRGGDRGGYRGRGGFHRGDGRGRGRGRGGMAARGGPRRGGDES